MNKNKTTSFIVFIIVMSITALVFLAATLLSYYQVDKKYGMLLAFFMFVGLSFTTVGIYSGFKFKSADSKQRRFNLIGLIGNLIVFVFMLSLMGYAALLKANESQPKSTIDNLLCKKWKPVAYEERGKKFDTPEKFQSTRMSFSFDHTVESTGKGNPSIGDWKYDDDLKSITIVDKITKETTIIGVKNLGENEFVAQIGKPEESVLTLYFAPVVEK